MHNNVMLPFMVQALQDPSLCSSTCKIGLTKKYVQNNLVLPDGVVLAVAPGQAHHRGPDREQLSRLHRGKL
jgi:hypothetical protein